MLSRVWQQPTSTHAMSAVVQSPSELLRFECHLDDQGETKTPPQLEKRGSSNRVIWRLPEQQPDNELDQGDRESDQD